MLSLLMQYTIRIYSPKLEQIHPPKLEQICPPKSEQLKYSKEGS